MATHTWVSGKTAGNMDKALPNVEIMTLIKESTRMEIEKDSE